MNFLNADVPDPTDFPSDTLAPGLRTLDGSFRCDICGELYDAPVTIACGHCFCSSCIRTSLSTKQECPSCRKAANEVHIRPNPVLESVITAWTNARPFVLQLVRREAEERGRGSEEVDQGNGRKRKRASESSSSLDVVLGNGAGPSRKPDSSLKSPSKKAKAARQDVIDLANSDAEDEHIASESPKDFVSCPMCNKRVRMKDINSHIDRSCQDPPSSDSAAVSWSKLMGGGGRNGQQKGKNKKKASDSDDEYPLPLSTYTTLKDRQLKDMLAEHDLPLTGDRAIWEQRHQKWVMLFNANLDRSPSNRKTKAELRKELKKWEEERSKKKKTVVTDVKGYQVEYKSEFARLVEAARSSSRKSKPPDASKSSSPADLPDVSSPPPSSLTEVGKNVVLKSAGEGEHGKGPKSPEGM